MVWTSSRSGSVLKLSSESADTDLFDCLFSKEAKQAPIKHLWCTCYSSACLLNITVNTELNQEAAALRENCWSK